MPKTDNPILSIAFSDQDYRDPGTSGGSPDPVQPVTPQLRMQLRESLNGAREQLNTAFANFPEIPAVMVMQLRSDAIAKSHRPLVLIAESHLELIGNGALGEIILATTPPALDALDWVIAERQTKAIKANIAAIDHFFGWGPEQSLSDQLRDAQAGERITAWLNSGKPLIVELFHQPTATLDARAVKSFVQHLNALGLEPRRNHSSLIGIGFFVAARSPQDAYAIAAHPAVRCVLPVPEVIPIIGLAPMAEDHGPLADDAIPGFSADEAPPIVGVFDTGVDPTSHAMAPWIVGRDTHVPPSRTDYIHGTMVASVVAASRALNGNDPRFPGSGARILDVAGMETSQASAEDILDRLRESLKKHPDVKIWNLSLGTIAPAPENEFGWFAHQVDKIADEFGVLFVVSAGNTPPGYLHGWPCTPLHNQHRISSPADAVRVISVGSIAHQQAALTLVQDGEPSPFTRCGPGPVKTPKPDVVHYGGNCDKHGFTHGTGIRAVIPGDHLGITLGTSFSAPQVANLAAHIWSALLLRGHAPTSSLVKALLIHSAAVNSPDRSALERHFFGAGLPSSPLDALFCDDGAFTLLFEIDVADRKKWTKTPFPIPACLLTDTGKFRGEVVLTLAYEPPLDASMGAEYVRANVDISFGNIVYKANGPTVTGVVPLEKTDAESLYEDAQVEHGYKWSPVKTYRASFRRGKAVGQWALQASIIRRAGEMMPTIRQKAVVLVTLRGIEKDPLVYSDGIKALNATNWVHSAIANRIHVTS